MRNLQFMCGRFVSAGSPDRIAAYFDPVVPTEVVAESLGQNFNVAPTQDVYALVGSGDGTARLDVFHWGLVPSWAKDRKIGSRMINARAETLAEKPAFKGLFTTKRCIVPMDGFYEWKAGVDGGPVNAKGKLLKQPMFIHRADGDPLAVAGPLDTVEGSRRSRRPLAPQHHGDHHRGECRNGGGSRPDARDPVE